MSSESERYLEEARSAGTLHSSGVFSLDVEAMRSKLGQFQLPNPAFYILKLVQAGVAGGATYVYHQSNLRGDFQLRFDGQSWSADELRDLFANPLGSKEKRHLQHLAVGMCSALGAGPAVWELASPNARLTAKGLEPARPGTVENSIRMTGLPVSTVLAQVLKGAPETRCLKSRASLAPIPIFHGTRAVNRHPGVFNLPWKETGSRPPIKLEADVDAHGTCYFLSESGELDLMGAAMTLCNGVSWWSGDLRKRESWKLLGSTPWGQPRQVVAPALPNSHALPGILYGERAALGCQAIVQRSPILAANGSLLTPVQDGVAWDCVRLQEFPRGYKFWVSARGLRADLSHFKVVQDEAYRSLVSSLAELVKCLK